MLLSVPLCHLHSNKQNYLLVSYVCAGIKGGAAVVVLVVDEAQEVLVVLVVDEISKVPVLLVADEVPEVLLVLVDEIPEVLMVFIVDDVPEVLIVLLVNEVPEVLMLLIAEDVPEVLLVLVVDEIPGVLIPFILVVRVVMAVGVTSVSLLLCSLPPWFEPPTKSKIGFYYHFGQLKLITHNLIHKCIHKRKLKTQNFVTKNRQ